METSIKNKTQIRLEKGLNAAWDYSTYIFGQALSLSSMEQVRLSPISIKQSQVNKATTISTSFAKGCLENTQQVSLCLHIKTLTCCNERQLTIGSQKQDKA